MKSVIKGGVVIAMTVSAVFPFSSFAQPLTWGCSRLSFAREYLILPTAYEFTFLKKDTNDKEDYWFYKSSQWVEAINYVENRGILDRNTMAGFFPSLSIKKANDELYVLVGNNYNPNVPTESYITLVGINTSNNYVPQIEFIVDIYNYILNLDNIGVNPINDSTTYWFMSYFSPGVPLRDLDHLIVLRLGGKPFSVLDTIVFFIDTSKYLKMYYNWYTYYDSQKDFVYIPGAVVPKDPFSPSEGVLCRWTEGSAQVLGAKYWFDTSSTGYILFLEVKNLNDSLLIATFSFDKDGLQGKGFAVLNALNMQPLKVWHIPETRSLSIQPIGDTTFYLVVTKTLSSGGGITVRTLCIIRIYSPFLFRSDFLSQSFQN